MSSQKLIPKLHHLESAQSFRILFALEELAEAHATQYKIQIYKRSRQGPAPSLMPIFPLGKSPTMTVETDKGELSTEVFQHPKYPGVLTESRLILKFLSDTFGNGMWEPQTQLDKRQDGFLQEFANFTFAVKVAFMMMFELIPTHLPVGLRQVVGAMTKPVIGHFAKDLVPIFQLLEDTLSEDRPWFSGVKMGLADLNVSWPMDVSWQRGYLDKAKYPKLTKWYETITERPAYKRALEKGGKYNLQTF